MSPSVLVSSLGRLVGTRVNTLIVDKGFAAHRHESIVTPRDLAFENARKSDERFRYLYSRLANSSSGTSKSYLLQ